jgi:hypothetical protein
MIVKLTSVPVKKIETSRRRKLEFRFSNSLLQVPVTPVTPGKPLKRTGTLRQARGMQATGARANKGRCCVFAWYLINTSVD